MIIPIYRIPLKHTLELDHVRSNKRMISRKNAAALVFYVTFVTAGGAPKRKMIQLNMI
jgi:hypothetical protein